MAFGIFLLYIGAIFGAALLLRPLWGQWSLPMALPLTLFISLEAGFCVLNLLRISASFLQGALIGEFLIQRLVALVPVLWFWSTYESIRRQKLSPYRVVGLLVLPFGVMILKSLEDLGWWGAPAMALPAWVLRYYQIVLYYGYGLVLGSICWLSWHVYRTVGHLWQALGIGLLALFPLALYLYAQKILPYRLGAPMTLLVLALAVLHFRWLVIVPIARDRLADVLTDGVAIVDSEHQVVDANPAGATLLAQMAGSSSLLPYPSPLPPPIQTAFDLTQIHPQQHELDCSHLTHPIRHADAMLLPLAGRRRRPIGQLLLLRDISRRKQAEQEREQHIIQLQAAHERLQQLDQLKTAFFANISHEFRTPLTLSLGPLNDLLDGLYGPLSTTVQNTLSHIRGHNQRLLHLINELLELARLDAGGAASLAQPFDLAVHLPRVVACFQETAQRQGVALDWRLEPASAWIYSDHDAIDKILGNLLSNALKHTRAGERITVDLATAGPEHWRIEVRDTGSGIDPAFLPYLFERFARQVDETNPDRQIAPSTGIGLALVKQLVEGHRGEIQVTSAPGQGSCFTVLLPVAPAPASPPDVTRAPPLSLAHYAFNLESPSDNLESPSERTLIAAFDPGQSLAKERPLILIVDDHPEIRQYVASLLADHYQVLPVDNGWQGLQLANLHLPDLVIADVMMPGLNGYQLCQQLKAQRQTSHIPLILLTARAGEEDKLKGLAAQADDYLSKPFNRRELQARVANLLAQRVQLRTYYGQLFEQVGAPSPQVDAIDQDEEEHQFLKSVRQMIRQHLSDCDFQVAELALALQMSERQLQRKLQALLGRGPQSLLLEQQPHHLQHDQYGV